MLVIKERYYIKTMRSHNPRFEGYTWKFSVLRAMLPQHITPTLCPNDNRETLSIEVNGQNSGVRLSGRSKEYIGIGP